MIMDILSRVQKIISYSGLSERAFALKCGLKPTTLDMQLNGNRAISLSTVTSILNSFADVSSDWLLRGEGEMLKTTSTLDIDRIATLVDTIATLQEAINEKNKTIQLLTDQINHLKK